MDLQVDNNKPQITLSHSVYTKLNEMMKQSPTTVITSICALFIVIVLSVTIPILLKQNEL